MTFFRRLIELFRGRRRDAALLEEMEAHRAFTQDELERAGLSPAEAAAESRRRLGNVTLAREDVREFWIVRWLDRLRGNLRYGVRGLIREPAFSATTILTLGLGTAAVTTVFSVVDAEMWRPLPYQDPQALVSIVSRGPEPRRDSDRISIAELLDWRRSMPALSSIAFETGPQVRSVRHSFTEAMTVENVSANYFATLGRKPLAGRVFEDADAAGANAAVLGSRVWQRVFNSDPGVVGRTILVDKSPYVIVGIVKAVDASGPDSSLFLPIDERPNAAPDQQVGLFGAIGRMAPGSSVEVVRAQAQAEFDRRGQMDRARAGHSANVEDLSAYHTRNDGRQLFFFLGASVFVLVLTVVNIAGLVVARGLRRAPEFALRGALGGGTRAIVEQLAAEAALIAIPGAALGLWLTRIATRFIDQVVPQEFLWHGTEIAIDYRAIAISAGIVLVTMAGLALAPIGLTRRANASMAMATGTRSSGLPGAARTRERLLVAQISLTAVLLIGAGLFVKSFVGLLQVPLGFDASDGWSMRASLSGERYSDDAALRRYADGLVSRTRAIPGVRDVAVTTSGPLMSGWVAQAREPGEDPNDQPRVSRMIYRAVGPGYFGAIGTRITRGRGILEVDVAGAPNVAVVNEEFVRQFFKDGGDPIGHAVGIKGIRAPLPASVVTIIGVAANIKEVGFNEIPFADIYVPFAQKPALSVELIVRGNGDVEAMPAALKAAAAETDPDVPVSRVAALDRRISVALEQDRFNLILAAGFGALALVIAAIGIYGAMAYAAVARAREFGVRLALGAAPFRLLADALSRAGRIGMAGGAIGVALAIGLARWLGDALYLVPGKHNGLLFNVTTTDPVVLAGAAAGVIVVSLVAGFAPARRLARIDPVKILRAD